LSAAGMGRNTDRHAGQSTIHPYLQTGAGNEVINYSYLDPRYRIQTHVSVAYGTDNNTVEAVLVDAVRQVEGVLPDKPVDVLYVEIVGWRSPSTT